MGIQEDRLEAVNLLIYAPNYHSLMREIRGLIADWSEHPMRYEGRLSCLNSLIDMGLTEAEAFNRIVKLIERKRKLAPEAKRKDYQKELMRERRHRVAKAVKLQELTKGAMPIEVKDRFTREIQQRWRKARDEFIASKGELSWKDRNTATQEFWAGIDETLDKNIAEAKRGRI